MTNLNSAMEGETSFLTARTPIPRHSIAIIADLRMLQMNVRNDTLEMVILLVRTGYAGSHLHNGLISQYPDR
ncbi:hypothetical protein D3C79_911580 [compost metagenome]